MEEFVHIPMLSKEQLRSSPEKMYWYALGTREKLPEELHDAMMLWSFDPANSFYCRLYLDWIGHCDEMRMIREKFEKRQRIMDRVLFCSAALCFLTLVFVLVKQGIFNG